jgi:Tol biopolymer transport system component
VEVSPDGTRLAVSVQTAADVRAFVYDLRRRTLTRLAESLKGEVIVAAWSRDDRIAVQVVDAGKITTAIVRPGLAVAPSPVADSVGFWASSFSPGGLLLGMKGGQLWVYPLDAKFASPTELVRSRTLLTQPSWSPDARMLAYTSTTTGRLDVYLRSYPGLGEAVAVSPNGGSSPAWNPGGRELFYVEPGAGQDRMMAVGVDDSGRVGTPTPLFSLPDGGLFLGSALLTPYAVAPDGQRFYAVRRPGTQSTTVTQVNVVFNWFEELKAKLPARRPLP